MLKKKDKLNILSKTIKAEQGEKLFKFLEYII